MKARIKETGEFVEIDMVRLEEGLFNVNYLQTLYKTSKTIFEDIDWEQRRWELVKATMQGYCSNSAYINEHFEEVVDFSKLAILQADAVLEEYKKGGEE